MSKAVYIGICTAGTTSRMRADTIRSLLHGWQFEQIDTDIPFNRQHRIARSLGFRYKIGPVISAVNKYILDHFANAGYDLVWVDKAIYLTQSTTALIRKKAKKLVHFTPDTAFYENRSKHFYKSASLYDVLITTKKFELTNYRSILPEEKILLATQGYDPAVHKASCSFGEKIDRVAFVGLAEPSREKMLATLIANKIPVVLAGKGWGKFVQDNIGNDYLQYIGESIWKEDYAALISQSLFSLGLLSKRFPELHTTRTIEIPACGTALLTEKNEETSQFFESDEAIFFDGPEELVERIQYFRNHRQELETLTSKGTLKILSGEFSYSAIINKALNRVLQIA